ncbi:MAG: protein kinase [Chloroflexi bacterium]|nr:protein kinase [Chloroflexota bacterium]
MDQPQKIAEHFEITELIGRGGMGEVYSGRDLRTQTPIAIKVLKPALARSSVQIIERFTREGEALRQLNHPNIVKVLATLEDAGNYYIIMELVTGGTLADLMQKQPHLPIRQVLAIALELADALTRAHHLKIIHRDIKPSNVLLAADGTPRLTDFGIAHFSDSELTDAGVTVGTFDYLSPEASLGEAPDVRSDIWSFGILLYEMLAGRHPFDEAHTPAVITSILTKPIPELERFREDVPVALLDLVYRMLEKNRDARIPRMRMVGAELEAIIDGLDTQLRPAARPIPDTTGRFSTPFEDNTPPATDMPVLPRHNLPAFTTPFVGRDQEVAEISALMRDPAVRLVTLVGPGGIGKTRVAVAAASGEHDRFADGVFYIPLAPVSDPQFIVSTVAENLGFTFGGSADPKNELMDYLREKALLLVLDNFEHLIDDAAIIVDILQAAPQVNVVVISRERLRLRGEQVYDVQGMILPTSQTPDEISTFPAVQLFMQHAQRSRPEFALDGDTAPQVAHICWLVEGMPLGIELAAAWLEMLPIEEVVQEIEDSLDFLETDLQDVPERHRSLRAVFDSTWHLMTDDEQAVFMRLSVFRGGFTRDAAQTVTGATLRNLTTLVNKSLIRRAADGRYTPHVLLRQYAEEQFASLEADTYAVRRAHVAYYANVLNEAGERFNSKREKKTVDMLEVEIENIRASWNWALRQGCFPELDRMLHPLYLLYTVRSMLSEGVQAFRGLAQRLNEQGDKNTALYWRARNRESSLVGRLGDYALSDKLAADALAFFEQERDPIELALAHNNVSYATMMVGRSADSQQHAAVALELARQGENKELTLFSLGNLGYAQYLSGDYEISQHTYAEFNEMAATSGSPISHAFGLNNLGEILYAMGARNEVTVLYHEAYEIFKQYGHRRGMAFTLNNLGRVLFDTGRLEDAAQNYRRTRKLYREIGDRPGLADSLSALGVVALSAGEFAEARQHFTASLEIRRDIGDQRGTAYALDDLAAVALKLGDQDEADRLRQESAAIQRGLKR